MSGYTPPPGSPQMPIGYPQQPQQPRQQGYQAPSVMPTPPQTWAPQQPAPQPLPQQQGYGAPQVITTPAVQQPQAPATAASVAALFGSINTEAVAETHAKIGDRGRFKWEQGENVVRVMPPRADSGLSQPWVVVPMHYVPVPGQKNKYAHVCPKAVAGLPCPTCETEAALSGSTREMDQKLASELGVRNEVRGVVINRKHPDRGPKKAKLPKSVYDFLVSALTSQYAPVNFADPFTGRDVLVIKQGEGQEARYPVVRFLDQPSPLAATPEQMMIWAQNMPNLNADLVVPDYDSIRAGIAKASGMQGPQAFGNGVVGLPYGGQQPMPQQWQLTNPAGQPTQASIVTGIQSYNPNDGRNF